MISKNGAFRTEKRAIGGGEGEIIINHRLEKELLHGKSRLCAELIIEPGCSIGQHPHTGEVEFFYVLEGELLSQNADGTEEPFTVGDVMATGGGESHGLRNASDKPAKMLAIIAI